MGKLIDIESVYAILEDAGEALEMLVEAIPREENGA